MKNKFLMLLALLTSLSAEVFIYGPGGPAPVLKKLAQEFNATSLEPVVVIAGPLSAWKDEAQKNADMIYSGNSAMMDSFLTLFGDKLSFSAIQVLNIREAGIIVRPGNPKKINHFKTLLKSDLKIMVVNGAGQVGLYEDMALKYGKRSNLVELRKNIQVIAENSKEALELWQNDPSIDAIIIWKHWATVLGSQEAEFVQVGKTNVMYRACEIAITNDSTKKEIAQKFLDFIQSKEAQKVWVEEGWIANP